MDSPHFIWLCEGRRAFSGTKWGASEASWELGGDMSHSLSLGSLFVPAFVLLWMGWDGRVGRWEGSR